MQHFSLYQKAVQVSELMCSYSRLFPKPAVSLGSLGSVEGSQEQNNAGVSKATRTLKTEFSDRITQDRDCLRMF